MSLRERFRAAFDASLIVPIFLSVVVVASWDDGWSGFLASSTAVLILGGALLLVRLALRRRRS